MIYAKALGGALDHCLRTDSRVVVLGEDIADPYGGAFKVTRGLSTAYPDRVRATPVSEAAIVGMAAGLALGGFRPIAEIMFGDFLALCFDQVINHIAKYEAMYNRQVTCPVIIRTPSGGGRAYGPTHSQSLEKHFLGIPHLRVLAASLYHEPRETFEFFLAQGSPVLYIEHKLLYPMHMAAIQEGRVGECRVSLSGSGDVLPTVHLSPVPREDCSLTVLAYGYQAVLAQRAIQKLAVEKEIFAELLVPAQIAPIDWAPIEKSVAATGRLATVEEGTGGWSWGTEIAAGTGKRFFGRLRRPVEVLASEPTVIPSARQLERHMLMNADKVEKAIEECAA